MERRDGHPRLSYENTEGAAATSDQSQQQHQLQQQQHSQRQNLIAPSFGPPIEHSSQGGFYDPNKSYGYAPQVPQQYQYPIAPFLQVQQNQQIPHSNFPAQSTATAQSIPVQPWPYQYPQVQQDVVTKNYVQPSRNSKKRKTAGQSTRSRAMIACEGCRMKKVKCDLEKPVCGSCSKRGHSCVYRNKKGLISKTESNEADAKTTDLENDEEGILGTLKGNSRSEATFWTKESWFCRVEGVVKWPVFNGLFELPPLTATLADTNSEGLPDIDILKHSEMDEIKMKLQQNLGAYIDSYLNNIQTKNPFIDVRTCIKTVSFINHELSNPHAPDILDLKIPKDLLPIQIILGCCALGYFARPLTMKNLVNFQSSEDEKMPKENLACGMFALANFVDCYPSKRLKSFDLNKVQYHLVRSTFFMYFLKPLEAWNETYAASTTIMTILETYKGSHRKFSQVEHRLIERLFYSCLRCESELLVELSPSVPSSGIMNYPFPQLYPSIPLESISTINEESSWLYYLTEIVLRKLENKMLDEFYVPTLKSASKDNSKDGEYKEDVFELEWDSYSLPSITETCLNYLAHLSKIENSMNDSFKDILKSDMSTVLNTSYGFLKPAAQMVDQQNSNVSNERSTDHVNTNTTDSYSTPNSSGSSSMTVPHKPVLDVDAKSPLTPGSEGSSSTKTSQKVASALSNLPESIAFIKTRMITFKILLFRPLVYYLLHHTSDPNNPIEDSNPLIHAVLTQAFESIDIINIPLAVHRHNGSWFYLRNIFLSNILVYGLCKKYKEKYVKIEKVSGFMENSIIVFQYWREEFPSLEYAITCVKTILKQLELETDATVS